MMKCEIDREGQFCHARGRRVVLRCVLEALARLFWPVLRVILMDDRQSLRNALGTFAMLFGYICPIVSGTMHPWRLSMGSRCLNAMSVVIGGCRRAKKTLN